ncbi:MAG: hypothetical protein JWM39_648 [Parcubacteria group bacterium]|nr:hypothetical protein [Parcubacteria group bacterium]
MLDALSRYESLGTPDFFWELLTKLKEGDSRWTEADVHKYFSNRIVGGQVVFDGCLPFADAIGLIGKNPDGSLAINPELATFLPSEEYARSKILSGVLSILSIDPVFDEIFCSENISYDIIYHLIQIDVSAFPLKYANFRRLLIDFGFLTRHPDRGIRKLIVNSRFKIDFDKYILHEVTKRKMGIEHLEAMLERNQLHGAEAEDFVLAFEKVRLVKHPKVSTVEKISDYDVAAGYDVVSYRDTASSEYDRFIEVKSHSGDQRFFWSRNEVAQAKLRKETYFLYLVDRSKMNAESYEPQMIQNPYDLVFLNNEEWSGEPQKWIFHPVA